MLLFLQATDDVGSDIRSASLVIIIIIIEDRFMMTNMFDGCHII